VELVGIKKPAGAGFFIKDDLIKKLI